jgi:hypothetical protein
MARSNSSTSCKLSTGGSFESFFWMNETSSVVPASCDTETDPTDRASGASAYAASFAAIRASAYAASFAAIRASAYAHVVQIEGGVSPEESGARRNAARRSNSRYRVSFHKPATMRRHKLTAVAASAGVM